MLKVQESQLEDSDKELCGKLFKLLSEASKLSGCDFTGTGVIVHPEPSELDLFPIALDAEFGPQSSVEETIAQISKPTSRRHDGFHVLSPELELLAISQYFSPPVVKGLELDRERVFGGRYLAALFGSKIEGVLATGIATPTLGAIVFCDGKEFEAALGEDAPQSEDVESMD